MSVDEEDNPSGEVNVITDDAFMQEEHSVQKGKKRGE